MTSQQTCDRCGKTLHPGVGPDGRISIEMTGETICGDCMMKMLEATSPPVNDNFEVKEFSKKAVNELAQLTGVKLSNISINCKQFMAHDVEIKIDNNIYQIVFVYDLIEDRIRWKQSRDYLVSWMNQHPLSNRAWNPKISANPNLVANGRFVFIFLPEEYPEPPNNFGAQVAQELCRSVDATKIGWMICPVSTASEERQNQDIARTISTWAGTQSQPDTLRVNSKKVKFHFSPDECTCMIVQR